VVSYWFRISMTSTLWCPTDLEFPWRVHCGVLLIQESHDEYIVVSYWFRIPMTSTLWCPTDSGFPWRVHCGVLLIRDSHDEFIVVSYWFRISMTSTLWCPTDSGFPWRVHCGVQSSLHLCRKCRTAVSWGLSCLPHLLLQYFLSYKFSWTVVKQRNYSIK